MSERDSPLSFTVHSLRPPALDDDGARRTRSGRLRMLLVLAICAAPVIASYLTYFVIRPDGRTNYSELIQPQRPIPADLPLTDLQGAAVPAESLRGQWLLVVVSAAACDATCEKHLWLQRQLRETLGREKERVDKVWLIDDAGTPKPQVLQGVTTNTEATVLRVPARALAAWLQPSAGQALEDHMYIVDPLGNWMMRVPPNAEPAKLKRDVEKLLRASAGWDKPGR
jgi:cytochrome oxidase Cu insertion factor (SCO1/SenC/PrrC family)